jgi:hypothetical protein
MKRRGTVRAYFLEMRSCWDWVLVAWFADAWRHLDGIATPPYATAVIETRFGDPYFLSDAMLGAVGRKYGAPTLTQISRYGVSTSVNRTSAGVTLTLYSGRQGAVNKLILPAAIAPVVIDALLEAGR